MSDGVQRRTFTDAVIAAVTAHVDGKPVGDGEMPKGDVAGWQGEPNQDGTNFVPYVVVTPLVANAGTGPFGDPQGDVILSYSLTVYGVSREQCEWMADSARAGVASMAGQDVTQWSGTSDVYQRRIQQVVDQQIGAVQRMDQTDPAIYAQSDVVALWTSR